MPMSHDAEIKILEGELGSARLLVVVEFDGHTAEFQFDTGSNYTMVSNTDMTSKYPVTGSLTRTSAAGKPSTDEKITVAKFRVGALARQDFQVVRGKEGGANENRIGMDALKSAALVFDLKTNFLMTHLPASSASAAAFAPTLKTYAGGTFGIEASLDNQTFETLWDTGAELSVIDREFLKTYEGHFEFIQKVENGIDATGHPVEFDLYEMTDLKLYSHTISGKIMTMDFKMISDKVSPQIRVILGTNLIRSHKWTFDFTNARWSVED